MSETTDNEYTTHLKILNGTVMNVIRRVIEVVVGKNNAMCLLFECGILSPVKHCV